MHGHVVFLKSSLMLKYFVSPLVPAQQLGLASGTFCALRLVEPRSSAVKYTLEMGEFSLNQPYKASESNTKASFFTQ